MRSGLRYFCLFLCTLLFLSCRNSEAYEKGRKTLDSLDGALGLVLKEVKSADTVQLKKAIKRFTTYRFFIKSMVSDTLLPDEAEDIKRFFQSGTALENYSENRSLVLIRAGMIKDQLSKLRRDIEKAIPEEQELAAALEREKKAAAELMDIMMAQQKKYQSALQEFIQVLPSTEEFIRKHNSGELPTLVERKEEF